MCVCYICIYCARILCAYIACAIICDIQYIITHTLISYGIGRVIQHCKMCHNMQIILCSHIVLCYQRDSRIITPRLYIYTLSRNTTLTT